MVDLMPDLLDRVASPPIADTEPPLDHTHLARMTLGDRALEREVLGLFDRQVGLLSGRINTAEPGITAATAHTIKGSARSVGAWRVVRAAEEVEALAACDGDLSEGIAELKAALDEVRLAIAAAIHAH